MQFQRGTVVRSKAGHDKGSFFVVIGTDDDSALIADGKSRTAAQPKRKKLIHLAFTKTVLDEQTMSDDSKISEALETFNRKVKAT
ncbi:MAG: KOW domain-containing RNA-binding protein [Clostridia bacterium]|nr:KOW domain-containing RNA-binding protein [Clostridia bacterium]